MKKANKSDLVYSIEEASKILGIGRNLTYDAARRGEIPTIRIGKSIKIPKKALDQLLAEGSNIPEVPELLKMPPRLKKPRIPLVGINARVSIELHNKIVQSAIDHEVTLSVEISNRLEQTFKGNKNARD
jgi:excisionase family DNA binding protein